MNHILSADDLLHLINQTIDDNKAINPVTLSLKNKSNFTDYMVVATGSSARHVGSIAENVMTRIRQEKMDVASEGDGKCDWVVLDAGDVIVHIMREEVREYYHIEGIWGDSKQEKIK